MREIKFRAWQNLPGYMTANVTLEDIAKGFTGLRGGEVMQYTGLKDKNGIEIYEKDKTEDEDGNKFIVEWKEGGFVFVDENGFWNDVRNAGTDEHTTVTGHIFEDKSNV